MCTFGPIVIFMTALPLFYSSTWRQSKRGGGGGWREREEKGRMEDGVGRNLGWKKHLVSLLEMHKIYRWNVVTS